jgi:hypothetical protein
MLMLLVLLRLRLLLLLLLLLLLYQGRSMMLFLSLEIDPLVCRSRTCGSGIVLEEGRQIPRSPWSHTPAHGGILRPR